MCAICAAFSNPETAALPQVYLDSERVELVDWASLHIEPGTFMMPSIADLLFAPKLYGEETHFHIRLLKLVGLPFESTKGTPDGKL